MDKNSLSHISGLAIHREGERWNAYYTLPNSKNDVIFLGSIGLRFIEENPERRKEFLQLMRKNASDITLSLL